VRNRIRRRVYSLMQQIGPNIQDSCDIVITVYKQELKDEPQAGLQDQLLKQLAKAGATIKS
jgi:ribonuclease P protein component